MPSSKTNVKKVWVSDVTGRSLFGWKIKEEIFAIFFILVILALANDENIVKKVSDNIYIQIFVGLIIVYCIYNRIPWSLAFILIFLVAVLFSGLFTNVKGTVEKIMTDIKNNNNNSSTPNSSKQDDNPLMHLGARVFSWVSNDKNNKNNKSILKKVRFENNKDKNNESDSEDSDSDNDDDDKVCKRVSKMFGFSDDEGQSEIETDNETEPDTEPDTDRDNDEETLKNSLKTFMKENMKSNIKSE